MKPTRILAAAGGFAAAALLSTGCTTQPRTDDVPPPAPIVSTEPVPEETEDCEGTDFAEGDWLADCLGLGDPDVEHSPSGSKPSVSPPGSKPKPPASAAPKTSKSKAKN